MEPRYCAPADSQSPRWMLMFDDADRGMYLYDIETEAQSAFAHAIVQWHCYLWQLAVQPHTIMGRED